ncbi:MAG: hypothetical protein ACXVB2_19705 [Isosphaeraceae bacterium]
MRFGNWRGVPLALSLAAMLGLGLATSVRADGWRTQCTIPREVPAYDYTTGGEYYAPPVPYGHYAKDYAGEAAKAAGYVTGYAGQLHGCLKDLWDQTAGLFHKCGDGCGLCQGCGHGSGEDCGLGHGCGGLGHGCGGLGASGNDCGFCAGRGLFHRGDGGLSAGCGASSGLVGLGGVSSIGSGLGQKKHFAPCHASTVAATSHAQPAGQATVSPSVQSLCGDPGCTTGGRHSHLGHLRCRFCGGSGCGGCGGAGIGDPCSICGGLGHGRTGSLCRACGGCGLFKNGFGHGGTGCGLCGGKGCASCLQGLGDGGHGLASRAHGAIDHLKGSVLGALHPNKVDYFVGPGGPVPLTPGYVPYIVATRSPRDFFAFPPMNPNDP